MKYSRSQIHRKTHAIPALRFEDQRLTSFSGLVVLQALFARLALRERLRACFRHLPVHSIFGQATILLQLVVHVLRRKEPESRLLADSRNCSTETARRSTESARCRVALSWLMPLAPRV